MDFETFVHAEIDGLTRYAGVLVRDRQLAHDVLADALIAAAARWSRIGAMANPLGYVQRMVVTTFLTDRRTVTRRRTDPADPAELVARSGTVSPDPARSAGDRDEVERMLRTLPRQQRAALVLRYYLDWPDDEIARALGCAPATVRSHLSRALASLRAAATGADRTEPAGQVQSSDRPDPGTLPGMAGGAAQPEYDGQAASTHPGARAARPAPTWPETHLAPAGPDPRPAHPARTTSPTLQEDDQT